MWWPVLLLALSIAILVGAAAAGGPLQLANPDRTGVSEMRAAFEALPDDALVLVAMDGDLGTHPEIRPAVRAAGRLARVRECLRRGPRHRGR